MLMLKKKLHYLILEPNEEKIFFCGGEGKDQDVIKYLPVPDFLKFFLVHLETQHLQSSP